jgi:anti-sigma B factor antagonist
MATAPQLGTEVLDCLARGHRHVIVDLAGVRLVDSAGIGVLLSLERRVRAAGGEFVLTNASAHVRRVFALTGVDRSLRVET